MPEYFMGQELIQGELPANSPRPAETPPEGVIMTDVRPDGASRRYIYIAMAGEAPEEITISETKGKPQPRVSGVATQVYDEPAMGSPAYDEPNLGAMDVPEGIDMPANAVLPDNAVFSGAPSSCVVGKKPVMPCEGPKVPPPVPGQTIRLSGMQPQSSQPVYEPRQPIQMSGGLPQTAPAPLVGQPVRMTAATQVVPPVQESRQPIRMSGVVPQSAAPVATMSIQKAAPPAPVVVQQAQAPVPGGQVYVPPTQGPVQESRHDMSGNIKLSNSIETVRPVAAAPFVEAPPMADRQRAVLGQSRSLPLTVQEARKADAYPLANPISQKAPMAGVAPIGGPTGFVQNQVPIRGLGQAAAPAPGAPPPAPVAPPGSKCPGAVEMPDGRVIEPDGLIALKDLCELVPFLIETLTNLQTQGLAPGQKLSVVGGQPGVLAIPNQGSFGPAGGGFRAGGPGGFVGGGGGGPGPAGPQGAVGVAGPPGPGSIVEPPVVKTDGDFTAGPGAFVPVPGTALVFSMLNAGVAKFDLLATLGSSAGAVSESQSAQIGLRIDGTDYPLTTRLIHTFVGGVGEFMVGQSSTFGLSLGAGSHTVEVLLRGLLPGEYGGAGLGIPATIAAVPTVPLVLTVSHSQ